MCESSSPVKCTKALVTGGACGIGFAFANMMLRCGADSVMIGDIQEDKGKEVAQTLCKEYGENKAFFVKTDVTKQEDMENLFKCAKEKYERINIVINNAGLMRDKCWEQEIEINAKSLVRGTLLAFEHMGKHNGGCGGTVVNIASIFGLQRGHASPIYSGTKAFAVFFSYDFSHDYYYDLTGVKVFTLCPGVTETTLISDCTKYALEGFGDMAKVLKETMSNLPFQSAESCARCLIKILCSDECGGLFVAEDSECYQIKLPHRETFRIQQ